MTTPKAPQPLRGGSAIANITLDGSGNGIASIGPVVAREHWQILSAAVKVATHNLESRCSVFVGTTAQSGTFFGTSFTGSSGDTFSLGNIDIQSGMQVFAQWTGGDPGALATLTLFGTYTQGAPPFLNNYGNATGPSNKLIPFFEAGNTIVINNQGEFIYAGTPMLGNLVESHAPAGGTDQFGNVFQAGEVVYQLGNTARYIQLTGNAGGLLQSFVTGQPSEKLPAQFNTDIFNAGLVNEQLDFIINGPESTASPVDRVSVQLFDSVANTPGVATGFLQYVQAAGTPVAVVQATPSGISSGGNITLTFPANTTPGNCIVVWVNGDSPSGTDPHVSGITIGGVADHFASGIVAAGSTDVEIWTDQNLTPASTSVVVSFAGGTGAQLCEAIAVEFSGVALTAAVDQTASNPSGGPSTSYTSNPTAGLSLVGEIACGIVASDNSTPAFSNPTGWTSNGQINNGVAAMLSGYQILTSITGLAYANAVAPSSRYSAAILTLKPAASSTGILNRSVAWGRQGVGLLSANKYISTVPGSNPAVNETWHNLSLNAGFAAFGAPFATPRYQYEAINGGRVRLSGVVSLTANQAALTTIATLPAGYRPAATRDLAASSSLSGGTAAPLRVDSSGNIQINNAGTSGNFISLDGVSFELD